jgi:CRISPR/Cas system CSM-associated protein Csm4 (group 5 of RAMP superfamily)
MKLMIALVLVLGSVSFAQADETVNEQVQAKSNNVKRATKKGINRMKEMVCAKGDAKCLAEKAKHRVEEGAESVGDKTKEVIHKAN